MRISLRLGGGAHGVEGGLDDRGEIDRLHLEPQLAGDDAAHVEQVVDELRLEPRVALDDLEACAIARRRRAGLRAGSAPSRGWR